eukprot:gene16665-22444_t
MVFNGCLLFAEEHAGFLTWLQGKRSSAEDCIDSASGLAAAEDEPYRHRAASTGAVQAVTPADPNSMKRRPLTHSATGNRADGVSFTGSDVEGVPSTKRDAEVTSLVKNDEVA